MSREALREQGRGTIQGIARGNGWISEEDEASLPVHILESFKGLRALACASTEA